MTLQQKMYHQRQMANAIQRGDKSYRGKFLPTPQVCGTMTQQRTYAMDKAMEILNAMDM